MWDSHLGNLHTTFFRFIKLPQHQKSTALLRFNPIRAKSLFARLKLRPFAIIQTGIGSHIIIED